MHFSTQIIYYNDLSFTTGIPYCFCLFQVKGIKKDHQWILRENEVPMRHILAFEEVDTKKGSVEVSTNDSGVQKGDVCMTTIHSENGRSSKRE
jgi:hypothetical protein